MVLATADWWCFRSWLLISKSYPVISFIYCHYILSSSSRYPRVGWATYEYAVLKIQVCHGKPLTSEGILALNRLTGGTVSTPTIHSLLCVENFTKIKLHQRKFPSHHRYHSAAVRCVITTPKSHFISVFLFTVYLKFISSCFSASVGESVLYGCVRGTRSPKWLNRQDDVWRGKSQYRYATNYYDISFPVDWSVAVPDFPPDSRPQRKTAHCW